MLILLALCLMYAGFATASYIIFGIWCALQCMKLGIAVTQYLIKE